MSAAVRPHARVPQALTGLSQRRSRRLSDKIFRVGSVKGEFRVVRRRPSARPRPARSHPLLSRRCSPARSCSRARHVGERRLGGTPHGPTGAVGGALPHGALAREAGPDHRGLCCEAARRLCERGMRSSPTPKTIATRSTSSQIWSATCHGWAPRRHAGVLPRRALAEV